MQYNLILCGVVGECTHDALPHHAEAYLYIHNTESIGTYQVIL